MTFADMKYYFDIRISHFIVFHVCSSFSLISSFLYFQLNIDRSRRFVLDNFACDIQYVFKCTLRNSHEPEIEQLTAPAFDTCGNNRQQSENLNKKSTNSVNRPQRNKSMNYSTMLKGKSLSMLLHIALTGKLNNRIEFALSGKTSE